MSWTQTTPWGEVTFAPLSLALAPQETAFAQQYRTFYGLQWPGVSHQQGYVTAPAGRLVANVFSPEGATECVLLLHGYLDHSAGMLPVLEILLRRGYQVVALDLPGHGLSEGERAAIADFELYTQALSTLVEQVEWPESVHLMGFSTGGAIIQDYLLQGHVDIFKQVVLLAPLLRILQWRKSDWLSLVAQFGVKRIPRRFRDNCHDQVRLDFVRYQDPLQAKNMPVSWMRSLVRWEKRYRRYAPCQRPIAICQGDNDHTVDWRYNLPKIQAKFPNSEVSLFERAEHLLFYEPQPTLGLFEERLGALLAAGA